MTVSIVELFLELVSAGVSAWCVGDRAPGYGRVVNGVFEASTREVVTALNFLEVGSRSGSGTTSEAVTEAVEAAEESVWGVTRKAPERAISRLGAIAAAQYAMRLEDELESLAGAAEAEVRREIAGVWNEAERYWCAAVLGADVARAVREAQDQAIATAATAIYPAVRP